MQIPECAIAEHFKLVRRTVDMLKWIELIEESPARAFSDRLKATKFEVPPNRKGFKEIDAKWCDAYEQIFHDLLIYLQNFHP